MNWAIRILFCLILVIMVTAHASVYDENFDDGTADDQTINPNVCWNLNNATIPVGTNSPICMGYPTSRTLRVQYYDQDPVIGVDLRDCSGTSTLNFTYYQTTYAGVTVKKKTISTGELSCEDTWGYSDELILDATGDCVEISIVLTAGQINYVMWDHGYSSNALWIDDVSVDSTCPQGGTCLSVFDSDFGSAFHSGSVCDVFPELWDQCSGNGPYLTNSGPCGGSGDMAMGLGNGYPYSSAETVCIDLKSATSPVLQYMYSWDSSPAVSPIIELSTDGGTNWLTLVASHNNTQGNCQFNCRSLQEYIGFDIKIKFSSRSSSNDVHAYFDDILVVDDETCPTVTPTFTSTPIPSPTVTPTPTNTDIPTMSPTPTFTSTPTHTATPVVENTVTPTVQVTPPIGTSTPMPLPTVGSTGLSLIVIFISILFFLELPYGKNRGSK